METKMRTSIPASHRTLAKLLLTILPALACTGCAHLQWQGPEQVVDVSSSTFCETGFGGDVIYACDARAMTLHVWRWQGDRLSEEQVVFVGRTLRPAWLGTDQYVCSHVPYHHTMEEWQECSEEERRATREAGYRVYVHTVAAPQPTQMWQLPHGWYHVYSGLSRNGAFSVLGLDEESSDRPEGFSWKQDRLKIGLVTPDTTEPDWDCTLVTIAGGEIVATLLPSDDGRYLGVAAWNAGVAMLDVQTKTILWNKRPQSEVISYYLAFSPDGETVYAGGTEGCVYGLETRTGRVLSRWVATDSGDSEYCWRITCLAASADGEWVAAGTGPNQVVYLFSTRTGKLVRRIQHGWRGSPQLVAFSPDSTSLAILGQGRIKVWKLPAVPTEKTNGAESGRPRKAAS